MSVVVLCVGAAKAGTSWLHRQLSAHPECHFRALKELHYFNAIEGGTLSRELDKHKAWQTELLERVASSDDGPRPDQARRLADRGAWLDVLARGEDVPAYLDYLNDGAGSAKVVGEMTPAYALLPVERLSAMARMAPDVRFLYLLRDPVDRLWSHVRMIAGRRSTVTEKSCGALLDRTIGGAETQIVRRSDYAGALDRLTNAVPPARLLVEVFEEVVSGEGFARICDFLGVKRVAADTSRVFEGEALAMTAAQRTLAMNWLAPQYAAAEAALGRRPSAWAQGG
ncbi:MAG: sulfotransferase, partial [Pseudomonadota bacterium]